MGRMHRVQSLAMRPGLVLVSPFVHPSIAELSVLPQSQTTKLRVKVELSELTASTCVIPSLPVLRSWVRP